MKRLLAIMLSVSLMVSNFASPVLAAEDGLTDNGEAIVETALEEETVEENAMVEEAVDELTEASTKEVIEVMTETLAEEIPEAEEEVYSGDGDASDETTGAWGENASWKYDNGVLTVSGTGVLADFGYYDAVPWENYKTDITELVIEENITALGVYAFKNLTSLTKVTLPSTLTYVGKGAFHNCRLLTDITLPYGVTEIAYGAFHTNGALKSVDIPGTVHTIGAYAFYDCYTMTNVTIPASVKFIGEYAFFSCRELKTIDYKGTAAQWAEVSIGSNAIPDTITVNIPKKGTVTETAIWELVGSTLTISGTGDIPDYQFLDYVDNSDLVKSDAPWMTYHAEIESVVIGGGITRVGDYAFAGYSITSLSLPEGLLSIGNNAFELYQGETLILPSTLTTLEAEAFRYTDNITTLQIPASLTNIAPGAFGNCPSLKQVTVAAGNTAYAASSDGVLTDKTGKTLVLFPCNYENSEGERSYVIPEGVTAIGDYAFWGAWRMSVTLPSTLKTIGSYAFWNCSTLNDLVIPKSVTSIGSKAFAGCDALTDIYYGGTTVDWTKISIDTPNEVLNSATLHTALGGSCGTDATWTLSGDTLTISGTGAIVGYEKYGATKFWSQYESSIKKVVIEKGITSIGAYAFCGSGLKLDAVTLPEELVTVGEGAFVDYTGKELHLPSTLTTVEKDAFAFANYIKELTIPAALVYLTPTSFGSCGNLQNINVAEGNTVYKSVNGVMYSKDGTVLELFPVGRGGTFEIPDGVTEIGDWAFWGSQLKQAILPESVTKIGDYGFYVCESLESISIPKSMTSIGYAAFDYCSVLSEVTYSGTSTQWNQITIGERNSYLTNAMEGKINGITITDEDGTKVTTIEEAYYDETIELILDATVDGTGFYNREMEVISSDDDIVSAALDQDGFYKVTISGPGKATLTFASVGDASVKTTVTFDVTKMADYAELTLSAVKDTWEESYIFMKDQTYTVDIDWIGGAAWEDWELVIPKDEDEGYDYTKVLTLEDGKVKAIGTGFAEIYLVANNGDECLAAVCGHVYESKATGIKTNASKIVLDPTYSSNALIQAYPENDDPENDYDVCTDFEVTWKATPGIAVYYNGNGEVEVEALSNDKASVTITFKSKDGSGKTAKVTVQNGVAVQYIDLNPSADTVAVGKTVKVQATVYPVDATVKTLTWESSDSKVATVTNGVVKGMKAGQATIYAVAQDGVIYDEFEIRVIPPVNSVEICSGLEELTLPKHEEPLEVGLPIVLSFGGDSKAAGEKDVEIKVSGANAKNVEYRYIKDQGYVFTVFRPGKFKVTATSTDGTKKKASITVNVEQHVFDFVVNAPKNTPIYDDVWVVKEGKTITPQILYNGGEKALAPAASAKGYMISSVAGGSDPSGIIINNEKGTIQAVKKGEYPIQITYTDVCDPEKMFCYKMTLKVIPKNRVDLTDLELSLPEIFTEDARVAAGSQVQISASLNGLKISGVKTEWSVEETGESVNTGSASISKSGKLNLKDAKAGDAYKVILSVADKADAKNTNVAELEIEVIDKLDKTDIQFVDADGTTITNYYYTPENPEACFYVEVQDSLKVTGNFEVKSSSDKVLSVKKGYDNEEEICWNVKPVGKGTATVTVSALDGSNVKQTFKVRVNAVEDPVKSISIPSKTYTMGFTTPFALNYIVSGKGDVVLSYPVVQWTVSDPGLLHFSDGDETCMTTDAEGWINLFPTGRTGKVTLIGTAMDGSKKTVKVTIYLVEEGSRQVMEFIELSLPVNTPVVEDGTPILAWGKSLQFNTNILPTGVKNKNIQYMVVPQSALVDMNENAFLEEVYVKKGKVTVAKASDYTGAVEVFAYTDYRLFDEDEEQYEPLWTSKTIWIQAPVRKIEIANDNGQIMTGETILLEQGDAIELSASVLFEEEEYTAENNPYGESIYKNVLWSVSDYSLAGIDQDGWLWIDYDAKPGKTVTVTAAAKDGSGKKATLKIKIQEGNNEPE